MTSWCVFLNGVLLERKEVVCLFHFSSAYNATSSRVVALNSLLYAGCVWIAPQSKIWIDQHQNLTHYAYHWRKGAAYCKRSYTYVISDWSYVLIISGFKYDLGSHEESDIW
jgi:hypothetical protein